jgi:hypothetical protein
MKEEIPMDMTSLNARDLAAETAVELPDREMLSLVVIKNIANHNRIRIRVTDTTVGVQVCALVQAINQLTLQHLSCTVK